MYGQRLSLTIAAGSQVSNVLEVDIPYPRVDTTTLSNQRVCSFDSDRTCFSLSISGSGFSPALLANASVGGVVCTSPTVVNPQTVTCDEFEEPFSWRSNDAVLQFATSSAGSEFVQAQNGQSTFDVVIPRPRTVVPVLNSTAYRPSSDKGSLIVSIMALSHASELEFLRQLGPDYEAAAMPPSHFRFVVTDLYNDSNILVDEY